MGKPVCSPTDSTSMSSVAPAWSNLQLFNIVINKSVNICKEKIQKFSLDLHLVCAFLYFLITYFLSWDEKKKKAWRICSCCCLYSQIFCLCLLYGYRGMWHGVLLPPGSIAVCPLPCRLWYRFHPLRTAVAGQMAWRTWSQVTMDFQETQMKKSPHWAELELWWYVLISLRFSVDNIIVYLVCFNWELSKNKITCKKAKAYHVTELASSVWHFSSLTAAWGSWGILVAYRTHSMEISPSTWSCITQTSFWCLPLGSSPWQRMDMFMLRWEWASSLVSYAIPITLAEEPCTVSPSI